MRALVIGGSGQDGVLLSAMLLERGVEVVSVSRRPSPLAGVIQESGDVTDPGLLDRVLAHHLPQRVFHLAAHHRSSAAEVPAAEAELEACFAVNTRSFSELLEGVRRHCPEARILHASSCRIFGEGDGGLLDEDAPRRPVCPYGISKVAAMEIAERHALEHGRFVVSAILFNHESELRPVDFLSRKLALAAADAAAGVEGSIVEVGALDAVADWGCARDYVDAMLRLVEEGQAGPCVVASGELRSVAEFAEACFASVGLDWRHHVRERRDGFAGRRWRLRGNADKLRATTAWNPRCDFATMAAGLVYRTRRMREAGWDPSDHRSYR